MLLPSTTAALGFPPRTAGPGVELFRRLEWTAMVEYGMVIPDTRDLGPLSGSVAAMQNFQNWIPQHPEFRDMRPKIGQTTTGDWYWYLVIQDPADEDVYTEEDQFLDWVDRQIAMEDALDQ